MKKRFRRIFAILLALAISNSIVLESGAADTENPDADQDVVVQESSPLSEEPAVDPSDPITEQLGDSADPTDPTEPIEDPNVEPTDPATEPSDEPSGPSTETPDKPADCQVYEPASEGIVTGYFYVDKDLSFIMGIAPGTDVSRVCNVCLPGDVTLSGDIAATGSVLTSPSCEQPLTLIVTGDLNGDGTVTITDLLMLKSGLLGEELSAAANAAGDLNYDGGITITDFLRVKASLLGVERICAGRPVSAIDVENTILLTPGTSVAWTNEIQEASTYISGNENLILVDECGNITALDAEGSAFVYALTADGKLVDRVLVSVLAEKMEIQLERVQGTMFPDATQSLSVSFNHPFAETVTWSTSDPQVLSVSESGEVTAHSVGVATVFASIKSGCTISAEIVVIPPITDVRIERKLYKIKPGNSKVLTLITEPFDVEEEFIWESSDPSIATVSFDGTVTGVDYGTVTITARGRYSGLTASCQVKICDVKQVALTFDDGPSPYTDRLLDFLKENDIRVTFFLVANRIPNYKEETIREVMEGHEVGYHSYAHDMQTGLSSERITSDFVKSNAMFKELTGAEFTVWRTPGGSFNQRVLDAVELPHILWSLDTQDWKSLNANAVCSKILGSRDGHIVLIHDLHRTSVQGAIMALEIMIKDDYEFVTVTELLSRDGTPPENCVNYRSDMKD